MATPEQMRALGLARRRYVWTPELDLRLTEVYKSARTVGQLSAGLSKLAQLRAEWPRGAWRVRARELGLTRPVRAWSGDENQKLLLWAGQYSTRQIAKRLGRSQYSVSSQAARARLALRVREGYTPADLAECFGVSREKVARWLRAGKFGNWRGHGNEGRIQDGAVMRFIRAHPEEYDLRRVEQAWFVAMAFGSVA